MARLVEDRRDDSDFPDIADIGKNTHTKKNFTCKKATTSTTKRAPKSRALKTEASDSESESKIFFEKSKGTTKKEKELGLKDEEKSKSKKRILNQASDNPLLRPLPSATSSTNSVVTAVASESQESLPRGNGWVAKSRDPTKRSTRGIAIAKPVGPKPEDHFQESDDDDYDLRDLVKGLKKTTLADSKKKRAERRKIVAKEFFLEEASIDGGCSDDEEDVDGSDGMSDFIVNDSCILTEGESDVEVTPPPRLPKKLVKGKKPSTFKSREEEVEDLGLELGKLSMGGKKYLSSRTKKAGAERSLPKEVIILLDTSDEEGGAQSKPASKLPKQTVKKEPKRENQCLDKSSEIDEPFALLSFSPSENKPRKISQGTHFVTPPPSPSKKGLISPKKLAPRIPMTPHRPSMDAFWNQDVVNDWNEEYSPKKTLKKPQPLREDSTELSDGALLFSPKKSPVKKDRAARDVKKAFSETKHAIAESFLAELDKTITDGQVSKLAATTGGIKIIWSKKLNTTAGRANWKRETIRTVALAGAGPPNPTYRHHACIELAEKVIDDEDRLLNVIAHEFCHLANFMISNIKTNPHGKEFKAWASKCSRAFGHRGIEVTTKHSYDIDYKYIWECGMCGTEFKRHSKSIDPARHQCGSCKGPLQQTKPVPKKAGIGGPSEYQVFFKENLKKVKDELPPKSPQKEVMGEVGRRWEEYKASKLSKESISVGGEIVESREASPMEDVVTVARKLDFLDLTSP